MVPQYQVRPRGPPHRSKDFAKTVRHSNWQRLGISAFNKLVDGILASELQYASSVQQVDAFAMDAKNNPLAYITAMCGPNHASWQ